MGNTGNIIFNEKSQLKTIYDIVYILAKNAGSTVRFRVVSQLLTYYCVALDKFLYFSVPQVFLLLNRNNKISAS